MDRVAREKTNTVRLMLDSGAFTAWSKGETINLQEYITYIKANKSSIDTYVNLDVIPGSPGNRASPQQVEESARLSLVNLRIMQKAGLTPIPVYHMGERIYWLDELIKEGNKYIGISPATEASPPEIRNWLDKVFSHITDAKGLPVIKTHGFGVASFDIMRRYPWYSCDATSWALTAAFGSIYVPVYRGDKPDYSETPIKLTMSREERKSGLPADHYLRFGPLMRERVQHFLKQVGVSVEDVETYYRSRAQAVVFFYMRFQEAINKMDIRFKRRSMGFLK